MWSLVWVLGVAAAVVAGSSVTNDVFPLEEELDALPPPPPLRSHNEVFPLKEEDLDAPRHRHTSRHHKVHYTALHPQNSMCELKPIRQIVTHALCTSKEMENHVCVGTCFSYTVPQTEPETPGDKQLDYCDSCQASESHWTTIQLDCEEYGTPYQVPKKIQMITNCSCSSCHPREQQSTMNNEVTYPANEPRVPEPFYKMLPEAFQRPDLSPELPFTKTSLDELRKNFLDRQPEQDSQGNMVLELPPSFNTGEEEEDPNDVVSY